MVVQEIEKSVNSLPYQSHYFVKEIYTLLSEYLVHNYTNGSDHMVFNS